MHISGGKRAFYQHYWREEASVLAFPKERFQSRDRGSKAGMYWPQQKHTRDSGTRRGSTQEEQQESPGRAAWAHQEAGGKGPWRQGHGVSSRGELTLPTAPRLQVSRGPQSLGPAACGGRRGDGRGAGAPPSGRGGKLRGTLGQDLSRTLFCSPGVSSWGRGLRWLAGARVQSVQLVLRRELKHLRPRCFL